MGAFMRTTTISADCPKVLLQRWRALNNFKLDEENMLLLTKLICSERIIKSCALLIDFLKSTLDSQDVDERRAQDEASTRRVRGITMVSQTDENKVDIEVRPRRLITQA